LGEVWNDIRPGPNCELANIVDAIEMAKLRILSQFQAARSQTLPKWNAWEFAMKGAIVFRNELN
jgi:hypothetical protein